MNTLLHTYRICQVS